MIAGKPFWRAELPNPRYHEITFRRGDIRSARFASDGQTILYSAAWQGNPVEIFSARPGAAESRSLGLEHTQLLAVSPTGEMAVALNSHRTGTWINVGTLADLSQLKMIFGFFVMIFVFKSYVFMVGI